MVSAISLSNSGQSNSAQERVRNTDGHPCCLRRANKFFFDSSKYIEVPRRFLNTWKLLLNLLRFNGSVLRMSCFVRFGNLVACLKYVVLHLFNWINSFTRRRKKIYVESILNLGSADKIWFIQYEAKPTLFSESSMQELRYPPVP